MFDIGASIGGVTDHFVEEGYRVVAIEPLEFLCDEIESRYKGREELVSVINAVVHNKKGQVDFYTIEGNDTLSTLSEDWKIKSRFGLEKSKRTWPTVLQVDCVGIDDLIEKYGVPDFIKIDVEGSEYEALLTHNKKVDTIIAFEWVEELIGNTKKCMEHLKNIGYTKYRNSCCHIKMEEFTSFLPSNEQTSNKKLYRPIEEFNDNIESCFSPPNPDQEPHEAWGDVYVM